VGEYPDVIYYRRAFTPNYGLYLEEFLKHVADIFNTKNIYHQRMFTARNGLLGLAFRRRRLETAYSSYFVVVLRTTEEPDAASRARSKRFQYIGDSYVQGLMSGEALDGVTAWTSCGSGMWVCLCKYVRIMVP
jgi:hypothetical protein